MTTKAVRVSIDVELLRRIDADLETRKRGRSAFIRSAVFSYLSAKRKREIDSAITAAYVGKGAATSAEISDLVGSQAWPEE